MKMMNDMELEMAAGGNQKIEKTVDAIANSGILDYASEKVVEVFRVLEYILFR
ncbi:MAG: hypothetical protein IKU21_03635 [Anaerotignum sp.]|nr:hypothetical protein [Anaerotignum sp.]